MTRDMKASKEIMGDQVEGLPRKQSKKAQVENEKKKTVTLGTFPRV